VDTETEAEIREALEHLMRGRTTFIIAHRIQSVMNADLILVLDKGCPDGHPDRQACTPIYDIQSDDRTLP
jgi:ABC-type multidrug transport system fused ATPase/permease subunit